MLVKRIYLLSKTLRVSDTYVIFSKFTQGKSYVFYTHVNFSKTIIVSDTYVNLSKTLSVSDTYVTRMITSVKHSM